MSIPNGKELDELSDLQKDTLKELGTMGAGQTASPLSEFLEQPIFMRVPSIKMATLELIPDLLKNRFPSSSQIANSSASNTARTQVYEKTEGIVPRFRQAMDALIALFEDTSVYPVSNLTSVVRSLRDIRKIYETAQ